MEYEQAEPPVSNRESVDPNASRFAPPPVQVPPSPELTQMDTVRVNVETLVNHPSMEKEHALKVLSLFHDMENYMNGEFVKRDAEIAKLRFEVEKVVLHRDLTTVSVMQQLDPRVENKKGKWRC